MARSLPSVMSHSFGVRPETVTQRSLFNRSHGLKTTFDAGWLVPILVDEAVPGDSFRLKMSCFCRITTLLRPLMDNLYLDTFFFSVPLRLVWHNFKYFMGEQPDPSVSTDYVIPTMTSPKGGWKSGDLSDYFGIPTYIEGLKHSALFHRAYYLIWNEWFRDQNLQDSIPISTGDGPDTPYDVPTNSNPLMRRGKRKDYFTSCLPWPEKGGAVHIPLGTTAPVIPNPDPSKNVPQFISADRASYTTGALSLGPVNDSVNPFVTTGSPVGSPTYPIPMSFDRQTGLVVDLMNAASGTINDLRQAFQLQKMHERDARGGTRYTEIIYSHFGVVSPDARLQRPEYIGGSSTHMVISPVASTSNPADDSPASEKLDTPTGTLGATGVFSSTHHGFHHSFSEHCIIIGLACVRADLNYQQGLHKMFSRSTKYDFYWPSFAHLGEQAVLNKEIYAVGVPADGEKDPWPLTDNDVFGYQERYAEYRFKPSLVTGLFRSSYSTAHHSDPVPSSEFVSYDFWHLTQRFASLPMLGDSFIQENPPIDRVVASPFESADSPIARDNFYFDAYFDYKCARPLPVFSIPGFVDHF